MAIEGTVTNGAIVLDQPQTLPEGTRVEVVLKPAGNEVEEADRVARDLSARVDAFLSEVYKAASVDENAAMQLIYGHFHTLRKRGEADLCDRVLEKADVSKLAPVLLVAILTATAPLKRQSGQRSGFYQRAKGAILELRGPELTGKILVGLE
jgi:hypothetical protein